MQQVQARPPGHTHEFPNSRPPSAAVNQHVLRDQALEGKGLQGQTTLSWGEGGLSVAYPPKCACESAQPPALGVFLQGCHARAVTGWTAVRNEHRGGTDVHQSEFSTPRNHFEIIL